MQYKIENNMNKEQILDAVAELACSQGFYGRLLRDLRENPDYLDYLEQQHFSDTLDMILFLEQ